MKTWLSLAASTLLVLSMSACNGEDGVDGTSGTDGAIGTSGTDGINGIDGSDATALQNSISVPITDTEKSNIRVASGIDVDFTQKPLSYNTILRTGETIGTETFGLLKDENDTALKLADGSNYICNGQFGGSGPDHTQFITKGSKIFMITQFECQIGALYQAELNQDPLTGKLSATNLKYISQASHHGGYVHCAGSQTPWNSYLGSEEYEPNARDLNVTSGSISSYYDLVAPYFGGDLTKANPYYYGYTTEVTIENEAGDNNYTKHYSMGRMAHELAYVMPDGKTAYLSDDGTNDGFYMYVADVANDLTSGTLYAAKWNQTSSIGGGKADLTWIKLGQANDAELKAIVDAKPLFSDIFETEDANATNECPTVGFKAINTENGLECLKVKVGAEKKAAFLETRRYAAYMGATTEFRKFEGITYNEDNGKLYTAISQIAKGMEDFKKYGAADDSYDKGGNNDITLEYNKCGGVYDLDLSSSINDTAGSAIDSAYVATNMNAIITGKPKTYDVNSTYAANTCDVNSIASPDNVTYKAGSNLLIIGEDTGYHQNDMVWAFDTATNTLKARVATTPYGSETTSPYFQKPINGFTYMNFVTQHPFGESDSDKIVNPDDVQSYVGYMQIGGKE
ncbi:MAG: DUF839 domain-containing protein [Sulfurimonas sp.]|nr:DUF839 domain-containing protein [Sulfurimonas sp.]